MNLSSIITLFALLSASLAGCSKEASAPAEAAPSAETATSPASANAAGDPCALVADSEVRKAFAGAETGKRDKSLDQYGIATCAWETTTSKFIVQIYAVKGSLEDELRGRMLGSLDPLKPALRDKVRYEAVAGMGDEAMLVVEQQNEKEGILGDVAVLGIRRGERVAMLFNSRLVDGDRAATIKALDAVGRAAGPRL